MGVYIKGLKLPSAERQGELLILTDDGRCVDMFSGEYEAVELPQHGRLIDADAYHKEIRERYESAREWYKEAKTDDIKSRAESALFTFTECSLTLRKMPTVIEEEGRS